MIVKKRKKRREKEREIKVANDVENNEDDLTYEEIFR